MNTVEIGANSQKLESRLGANFARVNYLTHIDVERRLAYIETPKVACTSIKKFLMDQCVEGGFFLQNKNLVHDRSVSPLGQLSKMAGDDAMAVWGNGYRRFSFVRNPFSRLLSGYLDKLVNNEFERKRHLPMMGFKPGSTPTLLEFLERLHAKPDVERDIHFATQSSLLMVEVVKYDFIGRFEGFKRDFLKVQQDFFDIESSHQSYESFGKHHASNANSKIEHYFGEREAELVREIYQRDFTLFGYSEDTKDASERMPPVRVETLPQYASLVDLEKDQPTKDLVSRISWFFKNHECNTEKTDSVLDLQKQGLSAAFQSLGSRGEFDAILNLYATYPKTVQSMPIASNQVGKALLAKQEFLNAAAFLSKVEKIHPNNVGILLSGTEAAIQCGDLDEAVRKIEQLCNRITLPNWANRTFMTLFVRCLCFTKSRGDALIERVFLDEHFLAEQGKEWVAADLFLTNLVQNKPVDNSLLERIRAVLRSSNSADVPKSVVSRFMLQGKDFASSSKRFACISDLLGKCDRQSLVSILGWRMHPLNDFVMDPNYMELFDEIAEKQKKIGNEDLACMIRVVAGENVSASLCGREVSLGRIQTKLKRRPKLALCISGQLRGYEKCFPQWKASPLFELADVTLFVSTWTRKGRKFPIPVHAERVFSNNFLKAYCDLWHRIGGYDALIAAYPEFSRLVQDDNLVNFEELSLFYGTENIEIFDDLALSFEELTNQEKMFFQIANGFEMAAQSGSDFDLYMRLRPDLELIELTNQSWATVLSSAYEEGKLFTDVNFKIIKPHGLFVGDQIAIGQMDVMEYYSSIYSKFHAKQGDRVITIDNSPKPHSTLAFHLAAGGINPEPLNAIAAPKLIDPTQLLPEEIAQALGQDVPESRRQNDPLWVAIQQDLRIAAI
ncbi:sulfotransferase family protein [Shimia thalassica]|uniref:sulfotransferase family protein n=1 Tax=Shimia thalassica TaxID=1715693 RepID=UPI00273682B8|nr:sulfotransferase family protein [Shimia thalassica]MDP2520897.1 sulfotransferase family protein [Shimia thalassica]